MKHMTEAAIEILVVAYPQPMELGTVERIVRLAWPEIDTYEGGWWRTLGHAGLLEACSPSCGVATYTLSEEGFAMVGYSR